MAKTKTAKQQEKELYDELRARGLRKRTARRTSGAVAQMNGKAQVPKALRGTVDDLRSVLEKLEGKVSARDRAAAARKAARTRSQEETKRSATARRGARKAARTRSAGSSRSMGRTGSGSRSTGRTGSGSGSRSTGRSGSASRSTGRSGGATGARGRAAGSRTTARSAGATGSRSSGRGSASRGRARSAS